MGQAGPVASMRVGRHRTVRSLVLLATAIFAGIPNLAVSAVAPLHVTVSSQVTGFCDSPVWNTVTLHANVTGGVPPYTYRWDFGDGSPTATDAVPSHHYANGGWYTANVTVTDSAGASASGSDKFPVLQPPCPVRYQPLLQMPTDPRIALVLLAGILTAVVVLVAGIRRRRTRR